MTDGTHGVSISRSMSTRTVAVAAWYSLRSSSASSSGAGLRSITRGSVGSPQLPIQSPTALIPTAAPATTAPAATSLTGKRRRGRRLLKESRLGRSWSSTGMAEPLAIWGRDATGCQVLQRIPLGRYSRSGAPSSLFRAPRALHTGVCRARGATTGGSGTLARRQVVEGHAVHGGGREGRHHPGPDPARRVTAARGAQTEPAADEPVDPSGGDVGLELGQRR